jgi:hypothetical protein
VLRLARFGRCDLDFAVAPAPVVFQGVLLGKAHIQLRTRICSLDCGTYSRVEESTSVTGERPVDHREL